MEMEGIKCLTCHRTWSIFPPEEPCPEPGRSPRAGFFNGMSVSSILSHPPDLARCLRVSGSFPSGGRTSRGEAGARAAGRCLIKLCVANLSPDRTTTVCAQYRACTRQLSRPGPRWASCLPPSRAHTDRGRGPETHGSERMIRVVIYAFSLVVSSVAVAQINQSVQPAIAPGEPNPGTPSINSVAPPSQSTPVVAPIAPGEPNPSTPTINSVAPPDLGRK